MTKEKVESKQLRPLDPFPEAVVEGTVQKFPKPEEETGIALSAPLTFFLAEGADPIIPWGIGIPRSRDEQLAEFWRTESFLAGAVYSLVARNAAFEWEIEAPPRTKEALDLMLNNAIATSTSIGWEAFIAALTMELLTRDNGAFIEIIRSARKPSAPVVGLARLDSLRCLRTGNPKVPVIYEDRDGIRRKMPWWSIIPITDMPSPQEKMNGLGFCAVSRVLRMAQILKSIAIFKDEKISGRHFKAIHFVGGVSKAEITDVLDRGAEHADNQGLIRYILPQIVASLDPEKPVSTATIDLANLPDNFNMDEEMKWYITAIALGTGEDYQTFAPLPGGNLGTSTQSEVLHRKSSGKGPAYFMKTIESIFKYRGIFPANATFTFHEKDLAEEKEKADLNKTLTESLAILTRAGILTPEAARMILVQKNLIGEDIKALIPESFGLDMLRPGQPDLNIGSDQSDKVSEDVSRIAKTWKFIKDTVRGKG